MADNVRFLDQNITEATSTSTGGGISVYSASVDLGIATILDFTGSGITSITNTSGIALIDISGAVGPSGSAGPSGSTGPSGSEGNLAVWKYDSNTDVNTDPGAGYFRFDNTWDSLLISKLALDDISFSPAVNLGSVLNGITLNSIVKFVSLTNSSVYKYLQITGIAPFQSGYEVYDVTTLATNGTPSTDDQFGFSIPAPSAGAIEILDNNISVVTAVTSINFSGSAFTVTDAGNNAVTVFADFGSVFPFTGSAIITGSLELEGPFLVKLNDGNGDINKFQVNNEGVTVLGKLDTTPTAVSGGIFYSASNEFYLGFS
jgi:hypothetical protein